MKNKFSDNDLVDILGCLKQEFLHQENLSMYRDIHEHTASDMSFVGDDHVFSIYDKDLNQFYFVVSPYDVHSGKAPQHALVFKDGSLRMQFDYTIYANMRTGAMDALLLQALGVKSLDQKRLLIYGTGQMARWSIRFIKAAYPMTIKIRYINSTATANKEFETWGSEFGVDLSPPEVPGLSEYDYIFCHTSSSKPVIAENNVLNDNVIVTSYLSLHDFEEIDDAFWNTDINNIVVSWAKEIDHSKDLARACDSGTLKEDEVINLKDLLSGSIKVTDAKRLFFRSAGTPIQNAALIKYLISNR